MDSNLVSLSVESITADRLTGTLADNTDWGTSPLPARNTVAVFVSMQKMKYDSSVDEILTVTSNHTDPATDNSWTFNIPKDGWFRACFVAPEFYDVGTTYAIYDAVTDSSTNLVYRSKQSSNTGNALSDTSFWELIAVPGDLALNDGESNESANLISQVYQFILTPNSEYAFDNQIAIASLEQGDAEREQNVTTYEMLAVWLDGIYIRDDRAQYAQGERIARRFQSIATQLGLL